MDLLAFLIRMMVAATKLLFRGLWWLAKRGWRFLRRLLRPRSVTYGSARWATPWEVRRSGVLSGDGIILGKYRGKLLRYSGDGYGLVFASSRSGKGTSAIIPTLLDYPGAVVVTDPKSENFAITARARAERGPVYCLNAIDPSLSERFNPLDFIRMGTPHEMDDAEEIARYIIVPDPLSPAHWAVSAAQLLAGVMLYVKYRYADMPELCNLSKVDELIAPGLHGLSHVVEEAAQMPPQSLRTFAERYRNVDSAKEEAASVFKNAQKATMLFAGDRPAGIITRRSDFDMMDFTRTGENGEVPSLFVCVDESKLSTYGGFMRAIMGCALIAQTRAKDQAPPKTPALLLFDEAAAIGHLEPLESGVGYLATYARMLIIFQDLAQLRRHYKQSSGTIIGNAGVVCAFGVNDSETAEMLASKLGPETRLSTSIGQSQRNTDLIEAQHNQGSNETGRPLLDASEIQRLRGEMLVFYRKGLRFPVRAQIMQYFQESRWRGRFDSWRREEPRATKGFRFKWPDWLRQRSQKPSQTPRLLLPYHPQEQHFPA